MDPLSDVLSLLKPHTYIAGGFDAGGVWSAHFQEYDGVKCYAVVSGECWLAVDGGPDPTRLHKSQCFLLSRGHSFRLTNDLEMEPLDAIPFFTGGSKRGSINIVQGGGCCVIGGHFTFVGNYASTLLETLSPVILLQSPADQETIQWSLEKLRQELLRPQAGSSLIAQHLAHMMLIQVLRIHISDATQSRTGWLAALGDKQMSAALEAMHDAPGRHWTLEDLGAHVGMSRSTFANRFKDIVGTSPMEYLTRWRMLLAGDRLSTTDDTLFDIAHALGYESESAFSVAFRRVMGCSPRKYNRSR